MDEKLDFVLKDLGYEELRKGFRPAMMFRLCTRKCNSFQRCEEMKIHKEPLGRGRGSGRGSLVI